jgi:hypothetical protein
LRHRVIPSPRLLPGARGGPGHHYQKEYLSHGIHH